MRCDAAWMASAFSPQTSPSSVRTFVCLIGGLSLHLAHSLPLLTSQALAALIAGARGAEIPRWRVHTGRVTARNNKRLIGMELAKNCDNCRLPFIISGLMNFSSIAGEVLWKSDDYGCLHFGYSKESRRNTFTCDFNSFFECEAHDSRHWHDCTEVAIEDVQFINCIPTLTSSPRTSAIGKKIFDIRLDDEVAEPGPTVTRFPTDYVTNPLASICQKFGSEWMPDVR